MGRNSPSGYKADSVWRSWEHSPRLKRVLGAELTEAERILVITKTAMSFRSKFDIKNKIIRVYTLMLYGKTQLFLIQTDEITTFS